jgi:hypothetical protein
MTHERELDVGHDVEVLEGCRGATGMTALDFTAAAGAGAAGVAQTGAGYARGRGAGGLRRGDGGRR